MRKSQAIWLLAVSALFIAQAGTCDSLSDLSNAAQRVSRSDSVDDARSRARDAVSSATDARNSAMDSGSYDVAADAGDALGYANKAANAHNLDDARFFAKQAEQAAASAQAAKGSSPKSSYSGSGSSSSGIASINDYLDEPSGSDSDYSSSY
jgi:hypothetical protein